MEIEYARRVLHATSSRQELQQIGFEDRNLLTYAREFIAWADLVQEHRPDPSINIYALRAQGSPVEERLGEFELLWELARVCRNFVIGEVWLWALTERVRGRAVDDVIADIPEESKVALERAFERMFCAGLGVLGQNWHRGCGDGRATWESMAVNGVNDFVQTVLIPRLRRASRIARAIPPKATASREKVDEFLARVLAETGHRARREDIATAAGYRSLRELQGYQRQDRSLGPAPRRNIERVLSLTPSAFLEQLRLVATVGRHRRRTQSLG